MSFGKRVTAPQGHPRDESLPVVARRGGFPLGVLAVAVSGYVFALLMTFIPYFNPTSVSVGEMAVAAIMAALNVTVVAAVVLILVDLLFRSLKVTAVWAYALAGGLLTFGICLWVSQAAGKTMVTPALVAMLVFLPTAIGGSVLGLFRTRE